MAASAIQVRSAATPQRWTPQSTESDPASVEANLRGQDLSLLAPYTTTTPKRIVYSFSDLVALPGTTLVEVGELTEVRFVTSFMALGLITLPDLHVLTPFTGNLIVDGEDWRFTQIRGIPGAGAAVLQLGAASARFTLKNITIGSTSSGDAIRFAGGGADCLIHEVQAIATAPGDSAIRDLVGVSGVTVRNCVIESGGGFSGSSGCIALSESSVGWTITGNDLSGNDTLLNVRGARHQVTGSNKFRASSGFPAIAIAGPLLRSKISGNQFSMPAGGGAPEYRYVDFLGAGDTWTSVEFHKNTFESVGSGGAYAVKAMAVNGATSFKDNTCDDIHFMDYSVSVGGDITGLNLCGNIIGTDRDLLRVGAGFTLENAKIVGNQAGNNLVSLSGVMSRCQVVGNEATNGTIVEMLGSACGFSGQLNDNHASTGTIISGSGGSVGGADAFGTTVNGNRGFSMFNLTAGVEVNGLSICGNASVDPISVGAGKSFVAGSTTAGFGSSVARGNFAEGVPVTDFG
jgi:hypothetical protein